MTDPARLGVVTLGHVHTENLEPLTPHFSHIEQLVLDIPPRVDLDAHRAELNRAVDAATGDWILVVREREMIDGVLAKEIAEAMRAAKAWGFRIRTVALYGGSPLRIGDQAGELRLFHRRHLLRRGELGVQGTVVRLANALRAITFATPAAHGEYLAQSGVRHSFVRRLLLFARYAAEARTMDKTTLRYLWIEAAFGQKA
ncbi:MAG TPA: hypothetical protein VGR02_21000 [Thermoanaerobaculia bacterium]|jgi:hypothetical protein|nr:hypothetical protein [Thermoanaerobaculia bacterium]